MFKYPFQVVEIDADVGEYGSEQVKKLFDVSVELTRMVHKHQAKKWQPLFDYLETVRAKLNVTTKKRSTAASRRKKVNNFGDCDNNGTLDSAASTDLHSDSEISSSTVNDDEETEDGGTDQSSLILEDDGDNDVLNESVPVLMDVKTPRKKGRPSKKAVRRSSVMIMNPPPPPSMTRSTRSSMRQTPDIRLLSKQPDELDACTTQTSTNKRQSRRGIVPQKAIEDDSNGVVEEEKDDEPPVVRRSTRGQGRQASTLNNKRKQPINVEEGCLIKECSAESRGDSRRLTRSKQPTASTVNEDQSIEVTNQEFQAIDDQPCSPEQNADLDDEPSSNSQITVRNDDDDDQHRSNIVNETYISSEKSAENVDIVISSPLTKKSRKSSPAKRSQESDEKMNDDNLTTMVVDETTVVVEEEEENADVLSPDDDDEENADVSHEEADPPPQSEKVEDEDDLYSADDEAEDEVNEVLDNENHNAKVLDVNDDEKVTEIEDSVIPKAEEPLRRRLTRSQSSNDIEINTNQSKTDKVHEAPTAAKITAALPKTPVSRQSGIPRPGGGGSASCDRPTLNKKTGISNGKALQGASGNLLKGSLAKSGYLINTQQLVSSSSSKFATSSFLAKEAPPPKLTHKQIQMAKAEKLHEREIEADRLRQEREESRKAMVERKRIEREEKMRRVEENRKQIQNELRSKAVKSLQNKENKLAELSKNKNDVTKVGTVTTCGRPGGGVNNLSLDDSASSSSNNSYSSVLNSLKKKAVDVVAVKGNVVVSKNKIINSNTHSVVVLNNENRGINGNHRPMNNNTSMNTTYSSSMMNATQSILNKSKQMNALNQSNLLKAACLNSTYNQIMNDSFIVAGSAGSSTNPSKAVMPVHANPPPANNTALNSTYVASTSNTTVDSYEITPARHELPPEELDDPDNYRIDDIKSDDDTDDEDAPRKVIPDWAQGRQLRASMIGWASVRFDLDKLFQTFDMPDLSQLFTVKRDRFDKRTSSAVWHSKPTSYNYNHNY